MNKKSKFDEVILKSFFEQTGDPMAAPPAADPMAPPAADPMAAPPPAPAPEPPEPETEADAMKANLVRLAVDALKYKQDIPIDAINILEQEITADNVDNVRDTIIQIITPNKDVDASETQTQVN